MTSEDERVTIPEALLRKIRHGARMHEETFIQGLRELADRVRFAERARLSSLTGPSQLPTEPMANDPIINCICPCHTREWRHALPCCEHVHIRR